MSRFPHHLLLASLAVGLLESTARAQSFAVQQPVFESFGVSTSVSVPDRGRAPVAGAGRAARRSYQGLAPAGFRYEQGASTGSMDVGVQIHELEELDRQVLKAAAQRQRPASGVSPRASRAFAELSGREVTPEGPITTRDPGAMKPVDQSELAKLVQEGAEAEAQGRTRLALAYYRVAAGKGAAEGRAAVQRLEG